MTTSRISVRLSADLRRRVKLAANGTGKRESEVIREALDRGLQAEKTAYDAAAAAGIIGAVRGGPRDLSTNRRHFRGFGES